jgi:NADPH:quinone reductase
LSEVQTRHRDAMHRVSTKKMTPQYKTRLNPILNKTDRMKAILCKIHGKPDSLVFEDIEPPKVEAGKVVIQVMACGVTFPDTLIIQNLYQFKPELPFSPGGEVAGIVKAVGEGVRHLKVGDRVFALAGWGGYAEEVLLDAKRCFPTLPNMDFVTAASVMYNYGTSYHALKDRAQLQKGETLLVLGAGGGVGLAAVELGRIMGAKVIAAASSEEKLEVCREKGADFTINYTTENLRERINQITEGVGVDVVYDPVGGSFAETSIRSMAWNGRYLVVGFATGEIPKLPANLPLLKGCAIVGVFWGRFSEKEPAKNFKNIQEIAGFLTQGLLKPHIYKEYPLSETPEALWDLMNRKVIGKAVVVTDSYLEDVLTNEKNQVETKPQIAPEKAQITEGGHSYDDKGCLTIENIAAFQYFKDKTIGTTEWLDVTQEMINKFADATLDFQWIHLDEERAKAESPFGRTVAHGLLSLSLLPFFSYQLLKIKSAKLMVNYGYNKVRFITPVLSGQRIRMKSILRNIESDAKGHKLYMDAIIEMEGAAKPVCVAESIALVIE